MNTEKKYCRGLLVAFATVLFAAASASGADWGSIKGRFVFEGTIEPTPIQVTKDVEYCGQHKLFDETVVVGADGGLRDVFVFLEPARGKKVEIHPDFESADVKPAVLDNKGCRFEPHALVMWTRQPLEIRNDDKGIGHNTNAQTFWHNPKFNEQVTSDRPIVKKMEKSEDFPAPIACNIHPWMNAVLLIRDNPYAVASAEDGTFEIKNVPAGKQDFVFWHQAKGRLKGLQVGSDKTDRKAKATIEIKPGESVDLGDIKVAPDMVGK